MEQKSEHRSFDQMVDALAAVQRRKLLIALLDHDPRGGVPAEIVAAEGDADAGEQLVSMKHAHLPKLAEYGFIEWDRDHHEVAKGPNFAQIKPLLELLVDHADELPADWL